MKLLVREISPRTAVSVAVVAIVASFIAGREKPSEPVMAAHAAVEQRNSAPEEVQELNLEKLRRTPPQPGSIDPFAPRSFAPPPPKMADAAPAKPTAPPLPFTYLGKVVDGDKTVVFVARADENYALEAGQTVAGSYRVDKITEAAVNFTYLPMKTRQTLTIPRTE